MDSDSESKLMSLISQQLSPDNTDSEDVSLMIQIVSLVSSIDLDLQPKPESKFMSLLTQAISVFNSMDLDSQPKPILELVSLISQKLHLVNFIDSDSKPESDSEFMSLYYETFKLHPKPELISIIHQIIFLFISKEPKPDWQLVSLLAQTSRPETDDLEPEPKLISLLSQLFSLFSSGEEEWELEREPGLEVLSKTLSILSLVTQVTSLVSSMDLDSQPKPESKFMSLVTQTISVANSVSDSDPERELISLVSQLIPLIRSLDPKQEPPAQLISLINQIFAYIYSTMTSDSELSSLIMQILCLIDDSDSESEPEAEWEPVQLYSLSPRLKLQFAQGKFHVAGNVQRKSEEKGKCQPGNRHKVYLTRGEEASHFRCDDCNGEDHEECEKTPVEVKHPLHPKYSLQLALFDSGRRTRECFCCDGDLKNIFYYCPPCDYAMNIACADKPPVLSIDHPKWHEHTLALFPRQASLTCNICAMADASSPIYMCPPCDFVIHLRCLNLPRVIRISRHPHRISFTPSFDQGDWSCGVCRKKINIDYGGYSCIKEGCSYAAHSRCATQSNVWDGIELEGVPEDIEEEEVEPFVRIGDGIIQHFSHQQHHLRLDENKDKYYDDNKQCQACITPIYFGKFYSCMQCEFILHEKCAYLSRKIHHPIHPHLLTLVGGYDDGVMKYEDNCSACPRPCIAGFFYECGKEGCRFKLHVQCATLSEPLVHESHTHPLFLTSKPGESRICCVCKDSRLKCTNETFNCIECDFALCFGCATLPQKARYKHDKHMLTLSYGKKTSTATYWCEVCEGKVDPKERFYMCDEYCCVTLHIECLIGKDLYMKPGSSCICDGSKLYVLPNNHMSRPLCFSCKKRCPYKTVCVQFRLLFCSTKCIRHI